MDWLTKKIIEKCEIEMKIIFYIYDNYTNKDLNVDFLCQKFSTNRMHLNTLSKKWFSMTMKKFITLQRSNKIQSYINGGSSTHKEIAKKCGIEFNSNYYKILKRKKIKKEKCIF